MFAYWFDKSNCSWQKDFFLKQNTLLHILDGKLNYEQQPECIKRYYPPAGLKMFQWLYMYQ